MRHCPCVNITVAIFLYSDIIHSAKIDKYFQTELWRSVPCYVFLFIKLLENKDHCRTQQKLSEIPSIRQLCFENLAKTFCTHLKISWMVIIWKVDGTKFAYLWMLKLDFGRFL